MVLVLAGAVAFVLWPAPDRITKENLWRIHNGMSQTEVVAILGPPGDYRTGPTIDSGDGGGAILWGEGLLDHPIVDHLEWVGDTQNIKIWFEAGTERVEQISLNANHRLEESLVDRFHRGAKRRWKQWFP